VRDACTIYGLQTKRKEGNGETEGYYIQNSQNPLSKKLQVGPLKSSTLGTGADNFPNHDGQYISVPEHLSYRNNVSLCCYRVLSYWHKEISTGNLKDDT
jgi:hypothetical protein